MIKSTSLQDYFLNTLRKENILTTFFLINGFKLKGMVKAFDSFTVFVESDGKQQMIFKHAISTIIPEYSVNLNQNDVLN